MKKTTALAISGLLSALGVLLMFCTGLFPFATFALPAIAGLMTAAVRIECGESYAWVSYAAVALLGLIIAPDREAAVYYLLFFGYYPILKSKLEQLKPAVEWICKIAIAAVALAASYLVLKFILLTELSVSVWILLAGLVIGLAVFVLYDVALTRLISFYLVRIHPRVRKR